MSSNFNCSYMARSSLTYIPGNGQLNFGRGPSKGATQGPFYQSLVAIGPVVSEEKIKM
jgi:hypothetical protein